MKLYSKIAYHSTKQKGLKQFEDTTSEDKAFTGEGAQVHGWGLYLQVDKESNKKNYLSRFMKYEDSIITDSQWKRFEKYSTIFKATVGDKTLIGLGDTYETNCNYLDTIHFDELDWFVDGTFLYEKYNVNGEAMTYLYECGYDKNKAYEIINDDIEALKNHDDLDSTYQYTDEQFERAIKWCENLKNAIENIPDNFKIDIIRLDGDWKIETVNKKVSGSQYTVEIPDDWIFLEEGSLIKDMVNHSNISVFEGLVKSLWKLADRNMIFFDEWKNILFGLDGYNFYHNILNKLLGSEQRASWYLSEHGVNGISYDGGRDGECYVIFDCEGLKIIKEE